MNHEQLLKQARQMGCSDLHLTVGQPICGRRLGNLDHLSEDILDLAQWEKLVYPLLTQPQIQQFEQGADIDGAGLVDGSRIRFNVFQARGQASVAIRLLAEEIPNPEQLSLPQAVCQMSKAPRGLVLITGPTGSGKSTTLAALLQLINTSRQAHIITIEDPIEYVFINQKCLIHQREVHSDVEGFAQALRSALRQDPDVIMVGEMRDYQTISLAITAAETGHLVLSTLHTSSAVATIDRIIDVFPSEHQNQIRTQLASLLVGVVSQTLVPAADNTRRQAVFEVLLNNSAVANLIRENKLAQISSVMQMNAANGMQLLDQQLAKLVKENIITMPTALDACQSALAFQQYVQHN